MQLLMRKLCNNFRKT